MKELTKEHSLALITICGDNSAGKVDGVQLEYGIFDTATNSFSSIVQGKLHGHVDGSSCTYWNMSPTRTISQVILSYNFFQVNFLSLKDSIGTEVPLSVGSRSNDSFES